MTVKVAIVVPAGDGVGGLERVADDIRKGLDSADTVLVRPEKRAGRVARVLGLSPLIEGRSTGRSLRSVRPDVVITHGALGFVGRRFTRIHVYHGTMVAHSLSDRRAKKLRQWLLAGVIGGGISEFLSGLGAVRVAVSNSAAAEIRRYYRLSVHEVIENGVAIDEEASAIESRRSGTCFVGRRESRKGYDQAVSIAEACDTTLSVAGPGEDLRTNDLGVLDRDELSLLLRRSAAMVFPTRYEACSVAILEAMRDGCAVVTTPVGWVQDLRKHVPEYDLLLHDPNDTEGHIAALHRVLAGDPAVADAVRRARDYVYERNSMAVFHERWRRLVAEVQER
ncbi:glycosyltransferase family 4 protein [uncultured Microbacterium sp.]|uniref:glycosyltransferase family 4 protein n=1 Tax=uncultured Microbacterium sp. TaxID=191216 RepID=UPI0025F03AFF|nr:glycosyltransferase family 4 protein [uncultured Microbacterium sp.]